MPRLVDHEVRRREITDAVRRVIVAGGLEGVTFQSVAAEAGISVRLVQYYFGTKKEFLLATHRSVMEDAGARFGERLAAQGDAAPREAIRTILTELLPLDDRRREEAIVLGAFNSAAIVGRGLAAEETHAAPRALVAIVAHHLGREGDLPGTIDLDAELVLAAVGGLAQGMLAGVYAEGRAVELVDHLLDRTVRRS
ncbi:TetR/AcrR family transcriptional regulator [Rhodococcus sp. HNM0563]|uniref:TetR family transcriptional regulator n=1 Tax=unclassified Rhodococcus (in: high G+C Gram-positive bacteria) TaxID=192944 RepID=UPI00146ECB83|nr:TetR/AcrR family transcriptional regulator [Rhodococcus sp. F64268]MCK0090322.1 TetR/AcrR family transcriptional regulator [Rhodococcus sp. F64268]NLU61530.1 TetR/AcrR family transcriptional regulator [Rhodococcus sp. HNM0563]